MIIYNRFIYVRFAVLALSHYSKLYLSNCLIVIEHAALNFDAFYLIAFSAVLTLLTSICAISLNL